MEADPSHTSLSQDGFLVSGNVPASPENGPHRTALIMGVLTILAGSLGLLGWILSSSWLLEFGVSAEASVKANTALMLLLLGVYLVWVALSKRNPNIIRPVSLLPGVVVLLAGLTVLQYATGLNFGIDEWLFRDSFTNPLISPPGRPSLLVSGCLLCLSASLLLSGQQRGMLVAQGLALLVLLVVYGVLLGYITGTRSFYAFGNLSAVALHTALALLVAGVGVLGLNPRHGLMHTAGSPYWGGIITRYMAAYVLLMPPLLTFLYQTSVARQVLAPETGLPFVLFMFMFVSLMLFYGVANRLNRLDEQSRNQYRQLQDTEQIAREQADFIDAVLNSVTCGVMVATAMRGANGQIDDLLITAVNQKNLDSVGRTEADMIGQRHNAFFPASLTNGVFDLYKRTIETGEHQQVEFHFQEEDRTFWVDLNAQKLGDGLVATWTDISARKEGELVLQRQNDTLQQLIDNTQAGILLARPVRDEQNQIIDFRYVLTNEFNARVTGKSVESMIDALIGDLFPAWQDSDLFRRYVEVVKTGQPQRNTFLYEAYGIKGWFDGSFSCLDGCILHTFTDVTTLKQAEQTLQKQNKVLMGIVENGKAGISLFDPVRDKTGAIADFRYVFTNAVNSRNTGRSVAELTGNTLLSFFPNVAHTDWYARLLRTANTGTSESFLFSYEGDNIRGWFDTLFVKLGDQVLFTDLNVTGLKDAELDRQQQADLLERVMNTTPAAIIVHECVRDETGAIIDFRMVRVNDAAAELLQKPIDQIEHRRISQYFQGVGDVPLFQQYLRVVDSGKPARLDVPWADRWFDFSIARFGDGIVVAVQDITPMRTYRHQLEQTNRELNRSNENLASFAHVASHDLQEPLRKLTSFANILTTHYAGQLSGDVADIIGRMNTAAERMRLLIEDLLTYSRIGTYPEPVKPIDLTKLVQGLQEDEL